MTEAVYLINKQGLWYRPKASGYTNSVIQAGRYTLADAEKHTHPNGKDGPRDGMRYIHEDSLTDPDWLVVKDLRHQLSKAIKEQNRLHRAGSQLMKEKHKEATEARLWFGKAQEWREQLQEVIKWLTPSDATKLAFWGEFHFTEVQWDAHGDERPVKKTVPWDTVKEIMKAIHHKATSRITGGDSADEKTAGPDQEGPQEV